MRLEQGQIHEISEGGVIVKRARQPSLPHFKKHPVLGYYISKRTLFSFLKSSPIFCILSSKQQVLQLPYMLFVLFPKDLKGPERSERHFGEV